jgi:SAM-dependent methyltransferase
MSKVLKFLRSDLAEYLQLPYGVANKQMEVVGEFAKQEWEALNPRSPQQENQFYLKTMHYLQECTDWHDRDRTVRKWNDLLLEYAEKEQWESVLDYGCGIATHSLVLAEDSNVGTVVLADFNNPAINYASWKAHKYELQDKVQFLMFNPDLAVQPVPIPFDCIICTDVIGHSAYPYRMLAEVLTHCKWTLWNSDFRASPDDRYPMHHRKPPGWDRVWEMATFPVEPFLLKSRIFGQDAQVLARKWER